jgi:membrane protease YdiL (CAAX protease family)
VVIHSQTGTERDPGSVGLRGLIRRRPLLSFFVMANLLSWVAWTPYILSATGLGVLDFSFPAVLGTTQLLGMLPGAYLGPILSSYIVTRVTDGKAGLREWAGRLWRWRVSWRWYLAVAIGVPFALISTAIAVSDGAIHAPPVMVLVAYLPFLLLQMVTTGIAEEPGWRDFALPRLQRKYGPLGGTFILGPLWGAWHLPLFLSEWGGWPNVTWLTVGEFLASAVTFSVVITWVFNKTRQSLPLVMLLHVSVNTFFSLAFGEMFPSIADAAHMAHVQLLTATVAAIVLIVVTRGRLGYRPETEHPAQVSGQK